MFFSDDTILTVAILDAILNEEDYEKNLKFIEKEGGVGIKNVKSAFRTRYKGRRGDF